MNALLRTPPLWRLAAGRCDAAAKWLSRFYAIDPSKSLWVMA